jgi:hypothetical protein
VETNEGEKLDVKQEMLEGRQMMMRRVQVSPATASREPNCTPCLQNSNSEVAAITSQLLLIAGRLLYSYYIVRMIKFVRREMDRMCSTHNGKEKYKTLVGKPYTMTTSGTHSTGKAVVRGLGERAGESD